MSTFDAAPGTATQVHPPLTLRATNGTLYMHNPTARVSAASICAAQAREQGLLVLQQTEPAQALTPALPLPPLSAWTNLLRNELATDVGTCALSASDGGAPCAALRCAFCSLTSAHDVRAAAVPHPPRRLHSLQSSREQYVLHSLSL